jgi:hypothetical protein
MIGVMKISNTKTDYLVLKKTAYISTGNASWIKGAPSYRIYGTILSGGRFSRHFVPGLEFGHFGKLGLGRVGSSAQRATRAQGLPHRRQLKLLMLEFERFDWIASTEDEGILIFNEPLKILALNQLNGIG